MVSLAEQTENRFGDKPIIKIPQMGLPAPLPDPNSPEISAIRKKMILEGVPNVAKKTALGVAVGIPAIPSDILELNKLVNDLAINYGSKNISAIAQSVQPQIDFLQQKLGRDKFDKMLNSIGIPSDASDPAQMTGEIISGFLTGAVLVKGIQTGIKKSLPKDKQVYKEPLKFPKSQLEVTRETLPAFKAVDIENLDATTKKVFNTVFTTRKPATDYFKDLFNTNIYEAREYLSELLYSKTFGGTKEFYDIVSENRLNKVKKNIYNLTQKKLEAYPEKIIVYRTGSLDPRNLKKYDVDASDIPTSFTLNPDFDLKSFYLRSNVKNPPLEKYEVNKKDILASADLYKSNFEDEIIIRPKDVTLKPTTTYTKNIYHLGKGEIKGDKFNLMGESDFGIHVGTKGQADTMNKIKYGVVEPTMKPTLELEGKEIKALGQRTFPLQIADDLKPARIPDVESFKMPKKWLDHLAVASDDKAGMDYMTQTTAAKTDLKNRPRVEYKGVTYYMSDNAKEMDIKNYDPKLNQSMVREEMDEQLWKDLVLSALEEQTRLKKNKSVDFKERQVWFDKIKEVANKNGYDSYIYRNEKERDQLDMWADSYMLLEQDQVKYEFSKTKTKGNPRLDKHKGGII